MAAAVSLSFSLDPQNHHRPIPSRFYTNLAFRPHQTQPFTTILNHPHPLKSNTCTSKSSSSSSSSTSSSHSSTPSSFLDDPFRTGRFLSNQELEQLKFLENFRYFHDLKSGSMWVRVMRADEMDVTVSLLAESFAESMLLPSGYVSILRFLVKQYLIERRTLLPHTATLIGFYRSFGEGEEVQEQLAGTVEVSFDKRGANASPPTPTPPKDSPYICNMTVKKPLRRRGIGWHLLQASEELISTMSSSREVYLHCRLIDTAPFDMYTKAGYSIVKTDNILVLLMLQRRKHLMCKELPILNSMTESNMSDLDEERTS